MLSGTARGGFGCRGETVAEHAFQSVRWTGRATARFSDSDGWLAPEETTGGPSSCSGSRCGSTGGYEIDGLWPCVLSSWLASERAAAGRRIRPVCLAPPKPSSSNCLTTRCPRRCWKRTSVELLEREMCWVRRLSVTRGWRVAQWQLIRQCRWGSACRRWQIHPLQGELPASGRSGRCERSISQLRDQSALVMVCHSRTATDGIRFPMRAPSMSWSM